MRYCLGIGICLFWGALATLFIWARRRHLDQVARQERRRLEKYLGAC